jgi:hypothetical protein
MNVTTNGKLFPLWDVDIDETALRLEKLFDINKDLKRKIFIQICTFLFQGISYLIFLIEIETNRLTFDVCLVLKSVCKDLNSS